MGSYHIQKESEHKYTTTCPRSHTHIQTSQAGLKQKVRKVKKGVLKARDKRLNPAERLLLLQSAQSENRQMNKRNSGDDNKTARTHAHTRNRTWGGGSE
jgi:hypothetical protein